MSESNQNNSGFYYVYILQSIDYPDKFYTGFTENLQKRLRGHNSGRKSTYGKKQTLANCFPYATATVHNALNDMLF